MVWLKEILKKFNKKIFVKSKKIRIFASDDDEPTAFWQSIV